MSSPSAPAVRSLVRIGAAIFLLLAVSACSGQSTRKTPEEQALVTKKATSRVSANSPADVVMALWRAVQVGDVPSAVGYYDPNVRRAIGFTTIAGTLAQQRSAFAVLRPEIASITRTPLGLEVITRATSGGSGVGIQSFLLRHGVEGWRVAYDTILGDALAGYVQLQVQHRVAPRSNVPSPVAQTAGERASLRYQSLFASSLPGAHPPPSPSKPRS